MAVSRSQSNKIEYVGAVLHEREKNGYQDSDFYVTVWDDVTNGPLTFEYMSTRYPGSGYARVDATPDVLRKYANWGVSKWIADAKAVDIEQASELKIGKQVRVVADASPKQHRGKVGYIFWQGVDNFTRIRDRVYYRYGVKVACECIGEHPGDDGDEVIWTSWSNLEVLNPSRYTTRTDSQNRRRGAAIAQDWVGDNGTMYVSNAETRLARAAAVWHA